MGRFNVQPTKPGAVATPYYRNPPGLNFGGTCAAEGCPARGQSISHVGDRVTTNPYALKGNPRGSRRGETTCTAAPVTGTTSKQAIERSESRQHKHGAPAKGTRWCADGPAAEQSHVVRWGVDSAQRVYGCLARYLPTTYTVFHRTATLQLDQLLFRAPPRRTGPFVELTLGFLEPHKGSCPTWAL